MNRLRVAYTPPSVRVPEGSRARIPVTVCAARNEDNGAFVVGRDVIVRIREWSERDAPAVAGLAGELGYPSSGAQVTARAAELARAGRSGIYVAEDGTGAVIGWIIVSEMCSLELDPHAEVKGLIVAESARSRGVGRALMAAGEAWARERGLREIVLRSNVIRERAHAFYKAIGYEEQKRQVKLRKRLD